MEIVSFRPLRVILGPFPNHPGLSVSDNWEIVSVVSYLAGTQGAELFLPPGLWVSESLLSRWMANDEFWPNPGMMAAAGQLSLAQDLAMAVGKRLKQQGVEGVWGHPLGLMSDGSLPWIGSRLRCWVQEGFRRVGVRSAWVSDPLKQIWQCDDGRRVVPQDRARDGWEATWIHSDLEEASGQPDPPRSNHPLFDPRLGGRLASLRNESIVLVDDPGILPLRFVDTLMLKAGFFSTHPLGEMWNRHMVTLGGNDDAGGGGRDFRVYLDALPSSDDERSVVIGFRDPKVIAQAPRHALKILLFDDHPLSWEALVRKLAGTDRWTGRIPWRLDTDNSRSPASSHYATEWPHPGEHLRWLESCSTQDILQAWIQEETRSLLAVSRAFSQIEQVIHWVVEAIRGHHRIFYVGAGSAGRAGVVDAVELPPTFGVDPTLVQGLMAGGDPAIKKAREGVEDDWTQGQKDIVDSSASSQDVVIGLSAHGDTPYVLGALEEAKRQGAHSAVIVNNLGTEAARKADVTIFVDSGPEILVGSTRLKAGTSEKVILNMISTVAMIRLGKSYDNLMVDFAATNQKLQERAIRVFMLATGKSRREAQDWLHKAQGQLPEAIVMNRLQVEHERAVDLLRQYGSVAAVIRQILPKEAP